RARGRSLCTAGAVYRAELIHAGPVVQFAAHGDRRRQRIFLRTLRRRADRRATAGMAACYAGVLPDRLRSRRDGDDGILSDGGAWAYRAGGEGAGRHVQHWQAGEGVAGPLQGCRDMTAILEVSNLRKAFGGIVAVDDVSFEVRTGEILGIIGPNGSG